MLGFVVFAVKWVMYPKSMGRASIRKKTLSTCQRSLPRNSDEITKAGTKVQGVKDVLLATVHRIVEVRGQGQGVLTRMMTLKVLNQALQKTYSRFQNEVAIVRGN